MNDSGRVTSLSLSGRRIRRPNEDVAHLGPLGDLECLAAQLVGLSGVDLAQNRVKRAMVCEALTRTRGNFTKAADLLGVRRQAIQHMVSRYDLRGWAASIRDDQIR